MSNQSSIREVVRKLSEKYGFPYEEGMKNIECVENSKEVSGKPVYGNMSVRLSQDLLSCVDPKGGKQIPYVKIMYKYKIREREIIAGQSRLDRALEEAIAAKGGRR
jgi:hypothetical protein